MSLQQLSYVGINLPGKHGAADKVVVDAAIEQGYDLVTAKITTRAFKHKILNMCAPGFDDQRSSSTGVSTHHSASYAPPAAVTVPPLQAEDLLFFPGPHVANTIALAAPWAELDARHEVLSEVSFEVLRRELQYAQFCGLPYVIIPGPKRRTNIGRYAQSVTALLREVPQLKLLVHTTFSEEFRNNQPPVDLLSTWEVWDTVRKICDYPPNLSLALEVPKTALPTALLDRWFAEPVSMLILSAHSTFVPNPKNFPVLLKHTQQLVHKFLRKQPFCLLKDIPTGGSPGAATAEPLYAAGDSCLIYLRHIISKQPEPSLMDVFSEGYADILQLPLQPLSDDLESPCYEVFERDGSKYVFYERAVQAAIEKELRGTKQLMIVVAGAGRGPLVDRVLSVCQQVGRRPLVYAVEKNPGAAAYLQYRRDSEWGAAVEVVCEDLRKWRPPHRIHLIVSELLGSVGDNELSPECLDALKAMLEPSGVMIPRSYTAFVAPVASPLLFMAARAAAGQWGGGSPVSGARGSAASAYGGAAGSVPSEARKLQTPYVTHMQQVDQMAAPQAVWQFFHPEPLDAHVTNRFNRYGKLNFSVRNRNTVYGFAGYFEAELYPGIELSTNPETREAKSPDLVSWFPFWFPLTVPLVLGDESEVELSLWRLTCPTHMWYEWLAESYTTTNGVRIRAGTTAVHNAGGACYSVRY